MKAPGVLLLAVFHTIYGVVSVMLFAVIEAWDLSNKLGSVSISY